MSEYTLFYPSRCPGFGGRLSSPDAVEALIAALSDENRAVRICVAKALGEIGDSQGVDGLIEVLSDESLSVRRSAAEALGKIGDLHAVNVLIESLSDERIQTTAARALGELGDYRAVSGLIQLLHEECRSAPFFAAEALGKIGDRRAVGPLIEALGKGNSRAAIALGNIGDPESVDGVMAILSELSSINRRFIPDALASIALKNDPSILKEYLEHDESLVRETAAQALAIVAEKQYELLLGMDDEIAPASGEGQEEIGRTRPETGVLARLRQAGSRVDDGRTEALSEMIEEVQRSGVDDQARLIDQIAAHGRDMGVDPREVLSALRTKSGSRLVQLKALGELTQLGDDEAAAEIQKYTTGEDMTERIYAARSLGMAGEKTIPKELIRAGLKAACWYFLPGDDEHNGGTILFGIKAAICRTPLPPG